MDSRRAFKWKREQTVDGKMAPVIRCRMALRGFLDAGAGAPVTFAGAAKLSCQRVLSSGAARGLGWAHVAVDVDGIVPAGHDLRRNAGTGRAGPGGQLHALSLGILRQVLGKEACNGKAECLRCVKPGTGCKGAPRGPFPWSWLG